MGLLHPPESLRLRVDEVAGRTRALWEEGGSRFIVLVHLVLPLCLAIAYGHSRRQLATALWTWVLLSVLHRFGPPPTPPHTTTDECRQASGH